MKNHSPPIADGRPGNPGWAGQGAPTQLGGPPPAYRLVARRSDAHGSVATAKAASIILDTDVGGRDDALNPVELLLAAIASCIIKGIERVAPMIHFVFEDVEVAVEAARQDVPPKLTHIRYVLRVKTGETDQRLDLLHTNVKKYGTIYNTVAAGTELYGTIERLR